MLENLPRFGSIQYALDQFEEKWGMRPTKNAVYQWAWKAGVHIGSSLDKEPARATRTIRWKREPELMQWMRDHDKGQPLPNLCIEFEAAHGFKLARTQASLWRMAYGDISRPGRNTTALEKPLGTRRRSKCGVLVKVREKPTKAGSKDNWEYEHHIAYEEAYGPIPEGAQVVFLDGDIDNVDPVNLYAVPNWAKAIVNGIGYHDRESMEYAMAQATLKRAIKDANMRPQVCKICGKTFEPWGRDAKSPKQTCRECLDAGRKYVSKGDHGDGICAVCGEPFKKSRRQQRRCHLCIEAKPLWDVKKQLVHYERTGLR